MTELDRFGLVFGCNMFAALLLQTVLTAIVAEKHGLALSAKTQVNFAGIVVTSINAPYMS